MQIKSIPNETIGRLFPYLRALMCLSKEGHKIVSSSRLAEICDINPAIIRRDFSYFGYFGKRGVGYDVKELMKEMRSILNLEPVKKVALIGVGNIGKALLSYSNFESEGFKIVMAFDKQPGMIGRNINQIIIEDEAQLEDRIQSENIHLAILAVPEAAVSDLAQRLAGAGVNAILSFAPCQPAMPNNVKVTCVDLSTEMARLIYYSSMEGFVK